MPECLIDSEERKILRPLCEDFLKLRIGFVVNESDGSRQYLDRMQVLLGWLC